MIIYVSVTVFSLAMIDVNKPLGIWGAGLYHLIVLHLSRVGIFLGVSVHDLI